MLYAPRWADVCACAAGANADAAAMANAARVVLLVQRIIDLLGKLPIVRIGGEIPRSASNQRRLSRVQCALGERLYHSWIQGMLHAQHACTQ